MHWTRNEIWILDIETRLNKMSDLTTASLSVTERVEPARDPSTDGWVKMWSLKRVEPATDPSTEGWMKMWSIDTMGVYSQREACHIICRKMTEQEVTVEWKHTRLRKINTVQ